MAIEDYLNRKELMFGLVHNHRLVFESSREVGGGVTSFAFHSDGPLGAKAGQHGILALGVAARKPFSLASAPEEDAVLIGTSVASNSTFKQKLVALSPGDAVHLRGPVNKFTLDDDIERAVLLGQGVGVTPLRAILAHAALTHRTLHSTLVHVGHDGHAYRDDTEGWASDSRYLHHSAEFRAATSEVAGAEPDATYFVAGAPAFVSGTASLLRDAGIAGSRIREDKYLFFKPHEPEQPPEPRHD